MKHIHLLSAALLLLLTLCLACCAALAETPADPGAESEPVWKFCHGLREGLETAVIKGYQTDCETGLAEYEMTPEEIEEIRNIAMNGVITNLASDEVLTGGTWVYTFETPEGEHLLSIEMYKGLIATAYGMYSYMIAE